MTLQGLLIKSKSLFSVSGTLYWMNWLLAGGFVWLSGALVSNVIEHQMLDVPRVKKKFSPPIITQRDKSQPHRNFKAIIDLNVFDAEVSTQVIVKESEVVKAPAGAKLKGILANLKLLGVYQGRSYYCVIKDLKEKKEDIFGKNDTIFETGAVVAKIQLTRTKQLVHVRLNDEIGILENKGEQDQQKNEVAPVEAVRKKTQKIKKNTRDSNSKAPSSFSTNGTDFYLRSAEVQGHIKNFATLLNQAKVTPYIEDGQNIGYAIKNITRGSLYEKLGLRNYDIIQSVNGKVIDSMEQAIELFNALKNEREITINILRNKEPLSFNYYIN